VSTASSAVTPIVVALLTGGVGAGIYNLVKARLDTKKAPAERSSIVAEGAEKAVVSLGKALDEAEERLAAVKSELAQEQAKSTIQKHKLERLDDQLTRISDILHEVRGKCDHLSEVMVAVKKAAAILDEREDDLHRKSGN
jgi:septation ring formation regulator EzrA